MRPRHLGRVNWALLVAPALSLVIWCGLFFGIRACTSEPEKVKESAGAGTRVVPVQRCKCV